MSVFMPPEPSEEPILPFGPAFKYEYKLKHGYWKIEENKKDNEVKEWIEELH